MSGSVVGLLHSQRHPDGRVELKAIYVDPPLIGQGVGGALMTAFDDWVADAPVFLDVAVYNTRAIEFYRRHGFHIVPDSDKIVEEVIPTIDMASPSVPATTAQYA